MARVCVSAYRVRANKKIFARIVSAGRPVRYAALARVCVSVALARVCVSVALASGAICARFSPSPSLCPFFRLTARTKPFPAFIVPFIVLPSEMAR